MEATISTPSGKTEAIEIAGKGDNLCSLKFVPKEEGVNTISLKFKGLHFAGENTAPDTVWVSMICVMMSTIMKYTKPRDTIFIISDIFHVILFS